MEQGLFEAIAAAPADEFWLAFGIAAVLALGGFIGGFVMLHRARVIEDTPTARVRSSAQGYAEFEGIMKMMDGEPVICPLSASRCVWWKYRIEEKQTRYNNGKRQTRWVTVDADTSEALFLLEDDTGECAVDPEGATVLPNLSRSWYGHSRRPGNAPKSGGGWLGSLFGRYRYHEQLLLPGRAIYAIGLFRTHGDGGVMPDNSGEVRDLLAKWKRDPAMRALLDTNQDGELDAHEWEAAQRMARQRVESEQAAEAPMPDTHLLSKAPGRRPFLLSALTQDQLIRRYRLRGWAAIAGFLAALAVTVGLAEARGLF